MHEYHKIPSIWKRSEERPHPVLHGEFNRPEFAYLYDALWVFTEKIDGTNIRVMWDGHEVTFGGRTDRAQIPAPLVNRLNELFGGDAGEQIFEQNFGDAPVTLFGEGYGKGIQKGGGDYLPDGVDFILFDVQVGDWLLKREDVERVAGYFDIKVVPVYSTTTLRIMHEDMKVKITKGVGFLSHIKDGEAEGVVGTPLVPLYNRKGERVIVKLKVSDLR